MNRSAEKASWYARKRLAENPDYQFRETVTHSPKRWTDDQLTESYADFKARKQAERRAKCA